VTWVAGDGIRYQKPEVPLAFKAKLNRPGDGAQVRTRDKDDADLARTWPQLDSAARTWLRTTIERLHPGHPWLELLH